MPGETTTINAREDDGVAGISEYNFMGDNMKPIGDTTKDMAKGIKRGNSKKKK